MVFPDDSTILALHKQYAPNDIAFQIVYGHCQIIDEIVKRLIRSNHLKLDEKLVHSATLLHDVGYYPLLGENGYLEGAGIKHGVTGADILRSEGIDEAICRIAERHTGVGLTKEGIIRHNLPLPPRDFIAETPEEWLVMYVDKLHTKAISVDDPHDKPGWFVLPKTYLEHARTFGEDNAAKFAQLIGNYGTPDLQGLADKYDQEIK